MHHRSSVVNQDLLHPPDDFAALIAVKRYIELVKQRIVFLVPVTAVVRTGIRTPRRKVFRRVASPHRRPVGAVQIKIARLVAVPLARGIADFQIHANANRGKLLLDGLRKVAQAAVLVGYIVQHNFPTVQLADAVAVAVHNARFIKQRRRAVRIKRIRVGQAFITVIQTGRQDGTARRVQPADRNRAHRLVVQRHQHRLSQRFVGQ